MIGLSGTAVATEAVGFGLGIAVFVGITAGGTDVAGIEVAAGVAMIAGAQALKTTASNNANTVVFIAVPLTDEGLTRSLTALAESAWRPNTLNKRLTDILASLAK